MVSKHVLKYMTIEDANPLTPDISNYVDKLFLRVLSNVKIQYSVP